MIWQHGWHEATHDAGTDFTGSLAKAPHGADVLKKFTIIGSLEKEQPECADPMDAAHRRRSQHSFLTGHWKK